jgi:hypothetical protein
VKEENKEKEEKEERGGVEMPQEEKEEGGEEEDAGEKEKFPEIPTGAKWARNWDPRSAEAEAANNTCAEAINRFVDKYGFDPKIFEVTRDYTQVMALFFSKLMPQAPVFSAGFGIFFCIVALDFAAVSASFGGDITATWSVVVFIVAVVFFVAFQMFWLTQKSNPDAITDGKETNLYADQNQFSVMLKLMTIKFCHFIYLQVANNVFQEAYNFWYVLE